MRRHHLTKGEISALPIEIPPLVESSESKLLGGFVEISGKTSTEASNTNYLFCKCITNNVCPTNTATSTATPKKTTTPAATGNGNALFPVSY